MPVQDLPPLSEGFAVQFSMSSQWYWTWGGVCFGYRREEWLFTHDGIGVGRFVGDEVYGANGEYLGELINTEQGHRLIASTYKKGRLTEAFSPKMEGAYPRPANRAPLPLYCGYEDFPTPEILKAAVGKTLYSLAAITAILKTKKEVPTNPRPSVHSAARAVAASHQPAEPAESAVVVDSNAMAGFIDTTQTRNAVSRPVVASLAVASQADQRTEYLRQLILDINGRIAQRRTRSK